MYRVEVLAHGERHWVSNARTFGTPEAAKKYGQDLFYRWTALVDWRVVPTSHPTGELYDAKEHRRFTEHDL